MYSVTKIDIKDVLTQKFNEEIFTQFAINLVNLESKDLLNFEQNSDTYEKYIDYVKDIGKYRDSNRNTIVLSIVKLKESPEKARTMQRNFIANHMKNIGADVSIVGLYSEETDVWRISFVKLDYSLDIDGIHEKLTPAKRYSYLIDPSLNNHTAQEQLSKLFDNDDKKANVEDIEKVFSVEVVTDEFFKIYKKKYYELRDILEKDNNFIKESKKLNIKKEEFSEEFAKKLMGQISFLYFLQKKGWLGVRIVPKELEYDELVKISKKTNEQTRDIINRVYETKNNLSKRSAQELKNLNDKEAEKLAGAFKNTKYDSNWGTGSKTFIRNVFYTAQKHNKNFFNEYLEPLFYNALNKERDDTEYYHKFNCKIPFLNGGLFEPIYDYNWENASIYIPNYFFSNNEKEGLLDLFDIYNFTMNEDEPLEKEIAVDPEMLGKIFENLLDDKERKSKGAFYTPREIVHCMCQESLINYLVRETNIFYDYIEIFIKYGEIIKDADMNIDNKNDYKMPKVIIDNLKRIDKSLAEVTIADPAVGSGAFPLGMLNEIVKARNVITGYIIKENPQIKLVNDRSIYKLKKHTMKNSLFAVDIEPSAVDITKLRLWLSLVVDADIDIINTLPNLEANIMIGNSLVEEFMGINLFDEDILNYIPKESRIDKKQIKGQIEMTQEGIGKKEEGRILLEIQNLQSELFETKDSKRKRKIKEIINKKEFELIEYKVLRENKNVNELKKIMKERKKPYFIWKMKFSKVFNENKGFDIVIGNPPYIGEKGNKEIFHNVKNTEFGKNFYQRRMDFFYFFIIKGIEILNEKGILTFITTNYWITATGGQKKFRPYLKDNVNIKKYINFGEYKIFESALGQHNCIFTLEKNKKDKLSKTEVIDVYNSKEAQKYTLTEILNLTKNVEGINVYLSQSQNELYQEKTYNINFNDNNTSSILKKIANNSEVLLGQICKISGGISSSADKVTKANIKHYTQDEILKYDIELGNGILVLNKKELQDLNLNENELEYIKKFYKSSEIKKYWVNNDANKFLVYATHNNASFIKECPNIYMHLKRYKKILENRSQDIELENAMKKGNWFVLTNGRAKIDFKQEKIVCPYRSKDTIFGYSNKTWYAGRDVYFLVDIEEDIKFLLGVLNSKVVKFWLRYKGKMKGDTYEIYPEPLRNIPLIQSNILIKQKIIKKVNKILLDINDANIDNINNKLSDNNINKIIKEIDEMVYCLYGINDEEVMHIEKILSLNEE